nr:MAG TPA: hypothetical protein [Caudoviricetes sp.]
MVFLGLYYPISQRISSHLREIFIFFDILSISHV